MIRNLPRLSGLLLGAATFPCWGLVASVPQLVSKNYLGGAAGGPCSQQHLSGDGRFLTFVCLSSDVVIDDDNDRYDTFLLDRYTHVVRRVSLNADNQEQRSHSEEGYPAADGSFVVFAAQGRFHPDVGALPFPLPDSEQENIFLRTFDPPRTELLGRAENGNGNPGRKGANLQDASPERREVLFSSSADYFGNGSSGLSFPYQLFVRNWQTGAIERISARPDGSRSEFAASGWFSPDGRYVVMHSIATDMTADNPLRYQQLFLRDRLLRQTRRLTFPWRGGEFSAEVGNNTIFNSPKLSYGAERLMFVSGFNHEFTPDDNPGFSDVYVQDVSSGRAELISRRHDGTPTDGSVFSAAMSDDGRIVAYFTRSTNMLPEGSDKPAIYVRDMLSGKVINVTAPLGRMAPFQQSQLALSADGSVLAFSWRSIDPSDPELFDRMLVYTVELRGFQPTAPPVTVPALSRWALALMAAGLALLVWLQAKLAVRQCPVSKLP